MIPYPLRQLEELCRAHPLRTKTLFVPSPRDGYNLTCALAAGGRTWTNLRVSTPLVHARERIRPGRPAAWGRRLDLEGRRWLVEAVLEGPAGEGLRPSTRAAGAGLAEALRRTFDELREAEAVPEQVGRLSPEPSFSGLGALYAAYCRELLARDWWDDARILKAAIDALDEGEAHPPVWITLDETEMPPLAHRYVLALSGGRLHRIGRDSYGAPAPADWAAVRWAGSPIPGRREQPPARTGPGRPSSPAPGSAVMPSAGLVQGDLFLDHLRVRDQDPAPATRLGPPAAPSPARVEVAPGGRLLAEGLQEADRERVRLWRTIGMETEIRAVLRDVLERGISLDEVEIAYTSGDPYRFLLLDAVERWELPADFAAGVPAARTRPGRALAAFLAWVRDGQDGVDLARSLRCGEMGWKDAEAPPHLAAHQLLAGRVGRGPEAAARALDRVERGGPDPGGLEEPEAAAVERRLAWLRAARGHLQRLHACVPEGTCTLASMADGAAEFLKGLDLPGAEEAADRDRRVRDAMVSRLGQISRGPQLTGAPAEQADRLLDALEGMAVDGRRANPRKPLHRTARPGRVHRPPSPVCHRPRRVALPRVRVRRSDAVRRVAPGPRPAHGTVAHGRPGPPAGPPARLGPPAR